MTVVIMLISRLKSRRMWLDVSTQAWTSRTWNATVGYETFTHCRLSCGDREKSRSWLRKFRLSWKARLYFRLEIYQYPNSGFRKMSPRPDESRKVLSTVARQRLLVYHTNHTALSTALWNWAW